MITKPSSSRTESSSDVAAEIDHLGCHRTKLDDRRELNRIEGHPGLELLDPCRSEVFDKRQTQAGGLGRVHRGQDEAISVDEKRRVVVDQAERRHMLAESDVNPVGQGHRNLRICNARLEQELSAQLTGVQLHDVGMKLEVRDAGQRRRHPRSAGRPRLSARQA